MSETWRHEDLQADLAAWLKGKDRMVWQDVQLGPVGSMRPDVYTLRKSFIRPQPEAYDVKISRSDFLADATAGKARKYQEVAEAVWYACPAGLVSRNEIPVGMGLVVRGTEGWQPMRRPIVGVGKPDANVWMKLLLACHEATTQHERALNGQASKAYHTAARKIGRDVTAYIANRQAAMRDLEALQAETEAARTARQNREQQAIRAATNDLKVEQEALRLLRMRLKEALGLTEDVPDVVIIAALAHDDVMGRAVRRIAKLAEQELERHVAVISAMVQSLKGGEQWNMNCESWASAPGLAAIMHMQKLIKTGDI